MFLKLDSGSSGSTHEHPLRLGFVEGNRPLELRRPDPSVDLGRVDPRVAQQRPDLHILPAILGERDDAGMWLGCDGVQRLPSRELHEHLVDLRDRQIIVRVKLFARVKKVPEYVVVVGKPGGGNEQLTEA